MTDPSSAVSAPIVPPGPPAPDRTAVVEARVEAQYNWYNDHANAARIWYYVIKLIQLVLAAGVPVAASVHAPIALTGSLGAAIVVLEGAQQLFQWHDNWIRYRTTAAGLAKERSLYAARAGDYASAADPSAQLAARVETLSSAETASWAQASQLASSPPGAGK
jgi:hypothetical protein